MGQLGIKKKLCIPTKLAAPKITEEKCETSHEWREISRGEQRRREESSPTCREKRRLFCKKNLICKTAKTVLSIKQEKVRPLSL